MDQGIQHVQHFRMPPKKSSGSTTSSKSSNPKDANPPADADSTLAMLTRPNTRAQPATKTNVAIDHVHDNSATETVFRVKSKSLSCLSNTNTNHPH